MECYWLESDWTKGECSQTVISEYHPDTTSFASPLGPQGSGVRTLFLSENRTGPCWKGKQTITTYDWLAVGIRPRDYNSALCYMAAGKTRGDGCLWFNYCVKKLLTSPTLSVLLWGRTIRPFLLSLYRLCWGFGALLLQSLRINAWSVPWYWPPEGKNIET
jgi:hypothetical protein